MFKTFEKYTFEKMDNRYKFISFLFQARDMTPARCNGFKVFPPSAFYPINYKNWTKYFESEDLDKTMECLKNSKAIHVWNKFSHERRIKVGSQVPYSIIAEKYCPKVYKNCGEFF